MDSPEGKVNIDGHQVDAALADHFYNASDGSRVTDEQWDESRRRLRESGDDPFERKA